MSSIAETDATGRFVLENVPPGRYYIAAGRLDFPTYFPGSQAMGEGTLVTVAAGATVPGIDFTMRDSSAGRADAALFANSSSFTVPLSIRVENGKVPLFGEGKFTTLRITPVAPTLAVTTSPSNQAIVVPLNQQSLSLSVLQSDYQLDVEGLPAGYSVKSMQYGPTTLNAGRLTLVPPAGPNVTSLSTVFSPATSTTPAQFPYVALLARLSVGAGVQGTIQTLTITLSRATPPARTAALVSGTLQAGESRAMFISGTPGALYSDGTFEFRDVPAGVHTLVAVATRTTTPVLGRLLVVGSTDMTGVELEPIAVPPANSRKAQAVQSSNGRTPGPIPLASVRGQITDSESGHPLTQGSIFLIGEGWVERELPSDGKFEFPRLLPGQYEIEVKAVGYPTFRREVVIEENDVVLELTAG